jgi:2-polyprenyl-3-methyl-5-hydroxy-6-metoxy-1,4-benzoquinol methylase
MRPPSDYHGHRVSSPLDAHRAAVDLLREAVPVGAPVLDLASGSGAMGVRLREAGYGRIACVARTEDLVGVTEHATPERPDAVVVSLDGPFAERLGGPFGAVICCETIEHVACPRRFLAEVRGLLSPGGVLVLTTPNVAHALGRLRFLLTGELRWFDAVQGRRLRHVSPITHAQMEILLDDAGFRLERAETAGSLLSRIGTLVTLPVRLVFRVFGGSRTWGDSDVYLARRVD